MIRTLVAGPASLILEGVVSVLSRQQDIEVIAAVRQGQEVIPAARGLCPQVALLASAFPGYEGIALARTIRAALPGCRCAILSSGRCLRELRQAITARIDGFLVQDCPAEFLTEAVRQLAAGKKVIDPGLAFDMVDHTTCPLGARELEALLAAAQGLTTAEIARTLSLADGTVRNYLSRAIAKTGARNRVDAIRIADERGWL